MTNPEAQSSDQPGLRGLPVSRKLLYSAVVVVGVFGTAELAARAFWTPLDATQRTVGTRRFVTWLSVGQRDSGPLYCEDSRLLWKLRPGQFDSINHHYVQGGEAQPIQITINEDGYRGRQIQEAANPSKPRILCLGDSNFFGYPLDDAHAFPNALERTLRRAVGENVPVAKLAKSFGNQPKVSATSATADMISSAARLNGHFEVINGGVPGYTVVQGRRWYEERFQDVDFDWLLLSYVNNDAWRQPQTDRDAFARAALVDGWFSRICRQSSLVGWLTELRTSQVPEERYVPRVPIDEFLCRRRLKNVALAGQKAERCVGGRVSFERGGVARTRACLIPISS